MLVPWLLSGVGRPSSRLVVFLSSACLLALVLWAPHLRAQNSYGALGGEVLDSTGARIPGAQVAVQTAGSSFSRSAKASPQGVFLIEGLLPGTYRVTVTAKGFAQATAEVNVTVSGVRDLLVTLKPGGGQETIKVQGNPSSITSQAINTLSAVRGGVVSSKDLETFPLPNRSFANIAYLVPGTEPVEPSDPTKARITAVSTGGSSGLNNELSVDGADDSDDWIGGFLQNFSPDDVQEFAVRTSNEQADTGWTTAGSVVITTKHGTNNWHGDDAFYERAAALNARFPIENPAETCTNGTCVHNPKQPFSRQNYVATLGGPIVRNKTWFFVSFENVDENASIAYSPASTEQFDSLSMIAAQGLIPGVSSIPVPANVPIPFLDDLGSLRFDWAQSAKSRWFLRASEDSYTTHNALVEQGTLPSTGLLTHNNYWNAVIGNTYTFSSSWLGNLVLASSLLHLTQTRNSNLGFALAFPFSSTALTVSGFETFGDNQFATPITFFPDLRNQEKYQARYDLSHVAGNHAPQFGIDFIHEPVLSGAFASTAEQIIKYPFNPDCYVDPTQGDCGGITSPLPFYFVPPTSQCNPAPSAASGITCAYTPAGDGSFSQDVQRLALYAQDSWRMSHQLTLNYGLRYQTTFGLFEASGRSQTENPAFVTLRALDIPITSGVPHDDHRQIAPRLGLAWLPRKNEKTVFHAGFGLYFDDLAQNGWATAFQAVNDSNATGGSCALTGGPGGYALTGSGCLQGGAASTGNTIGSDYKTPYAIHITGGAQHQFNQNWLADAAYVHEQGNHGYRAFPYTSGTNLFTSEISTGDPAYAADERSVVPNVNVFRSDNRSSYNALMIHAQGNMRRFSLIANYDFSKAQTWGCVLGELFDYVDGVCTLQTGPDAGQLDAFGPGDYGPSGEDVRHRFVLAGTLHVPGGIELSGLSQLESARPITITTADNSGRIYVNGTYTSLDEFRGTPYMQTDLRVERPFTVHERVQVNPFIEFFNLFNRNNPGANYAVNVAQLPVPAAQMQPNANGITNVTEICTNADCSRTEPVTSLKQLEIPEGALGDFFGPGTTVGIPFAAQVGVRATF
ncbi:MAG TPA: carboxypeptidase regulatory-like domain-containing protein [Acidobacteriaceae bacterium]|nr:carboxypeptidase regulatory-like domain-containing protein [Acidobacteriaceae bacterium]